MISWRPLQRFARNTSGFTLLEVMVAITILTLGIGLVGTSTFQVVAGSQIWRDDVTATKDLRHAGSWLAGDVLNAKATDLIDGAAAVNSLVVTGFNGDEITYNLSGNNLVRTLDDGSIITSNVVAKNVVSTSFALSVNVITFTLEVQAQRGGTETISLNTNLR